MTSITGWGSIPRRLAPPSSRRHALPPGDARGLRRPRRDAAADRRARQQMELFDRARRARPRHRSRIGHAVRRLRQQRIFVPLKMSDLSGPCRRRGRFVATNYFYVGDNASRSIPARPRSGSKPPSFPYGGAGLVMSARDYDRFLHMLVRTTATLDGVRVLKPETVGWRCRTCFRRASNQPFWRRPGTRRPSMGFGAGGSVYLAARPGGRARAPMAGAAPPARSPGSIRSASARYGMVNYLPTSWPLRERGRAG